MDQGVKQPHAEGCRGSKDRDRHSAAGFGMAMGCFPGC